MAVPHIDTFEHDIATEIKEREATIGDIASAGGDIGNVLPEEKKPFPFGMVLLTVLIVLITVGIGYFGYTYYNKKINPIPSTSPVVIPKEEDTSLLPALSPAFPDTIGRAVTDIKRSEYGYTLILNNYSLVFAYMLKNEFSYADDIARAVGTSRDTSTTTPPFLFSDITIENQNMRVGISGSSMVVYAFVGTNALIIASSTDNVLKLRGTVAR